jgi:opacity protein-like surface antigen
MFKPLAASLVSILAGGASLVHADESVLGFVRGAETLPSGKADAIQTITFRTGASRGNYDAVDSTSEAEYGATDRLQLGVSVANHFVHSHEIETRPDRDDYRFGGASAVAKYRILSPFKDPIGLALRVEGGYLMHSKVSGNLEHERFLAPELIVQKNFLDDTFITALNVGAEWDWGRQPAVNHPRDFALTGGLGASYRFTSNWFIGLDSSVRSVWSQFDFQDFEHVAVYLGPSLHYGAERWWFTLSWAYQIFGTGVNEHSGQTFAEDVRHQIRLKIGFNF